jgi:hypothetical protein
VPQAVEERWHTQQRAVSAWGVPQCGQRHIGMARMVAAIGTGVDRYRVIETTVWSLDCPKSVVLTRIATLP